MSRCLLMLMGCLVLMQGKSQTDKRLAIADQYFAAGDYFTAAGLYGQVIQDADHPNNKSDFPLNIRHRRITGAGRYKSENDIKFRQAESYRLANYWLEASALYSECFAKEPANHPEALYWHAVCQRSLADYAGAEESLQRFFKSYPASGEWYNAALQEKQKLAFVQTQLTRPDSVMYHVQKINAEFGDHGVFAPTAAGGKEVLITSTLRDSVAAGSNPYHNRLFMATFANNDWQSRQAVAIESIDSLLNQGAASISPDKNHLYLTQWKKENGQTISSVYYSNKTVNGWSKPVLLTTLNEAGHNSKQPFCSPDGKYLFFASDRTGGKGGFDIWYAPLLADGTTGEAINADNVNSPANEQAPFYHATTATLVFASDRLPGMGGYDLFTAKGSVAGWQAPENMGAPVNSPRDDIYFFADEGSPLLDHAMVSSDRGAECCLAVYAVSKASKKNAITGVVLDCAANVPLDSAKVVLKDAAGKTLEMLTGPDGKYRFDLSDNAHQHQVFISREKYIDTSVQANVERVDETNWQTDTLRNAALCLEKKVVVKVENVVTLYFDFNKSDITPAGTALLDSIYTVLTENPVYTVQISGFTDGKGSISYNKKLSEKRAKACADYLTQKGVDPARITVESFGALFPVEMELINGRDNADARSKNRRALININK